MKIGVRNNGHVFCKSDFYSAHDIMSGSQYNITCGINKYEGEIDSGIWAVSYLLSMYKYRKNDFVLFEVPSLVFDDAMITLEEFSEYSCYMDTIYPLFDSKTPVDRLIEKAIRSNKLDYTPESIRELFCIDEERFKRPLSGMGNERFKAMAAIGYVNKKQVYCFPWMSYKRYCGYHEHLQWLIDKLSEFNKVVVLPIGKK